MAQTIQAVAEALTLARSAASTPAKVRDALLGGFAQSRILDLHGKRMLDRTFAARLPHRAAPQGPQHRPANGAKNGVSLPATAIVAEQMNALIAQGDGKKDHSALALLGRTAGESGVTE